MSDKKYDNSGVLFKNDRRTQDKHPEYTGSLTIGGVEYWLSAWVKQGQKGKFFSLSVKPKEERQAPLPAAAAAAPRPAPAAKAPAPAAEDDGGIPF